MKASIVFRHCSEGKTAEMDFKMADADSSIKSAESLATVIVFYHKSVKINC
jgi:hypothetical protein